MGGGSGGQAAMTVVWVASAVLAACGFGLFAWAWGRRAGRSRAGNGRGHGGD